MASPEYVADTANGDRIGVVQQRHEGSVYLCPPGGGTEWATAPETLLHLSREELARVHVYETPVGRCR